MCELIKYKIINNIKNKCMNYTLKYSIPMKMLVYNTSFIEKIYKYDITEL